VRDLDISGRQVWLSVRMRQFFCPDCDRYFTERLAFADPGKSHSHRQANGVARRWIFDCCAKQPFTEVGALLDVNAKTVERIYYRQVRARLDLPARYAAVRRLGIDEIDHRKGKASYCCVLVDLDRNIALDVLPSRTKFCAQIESVSFDMWSAYSTISKRFFLQAIHVVDRFHVVKALNKSLDVFRRKLRREQPEVEAFKNISWDLFKARPTPAQQARLQAAFAYSPLLGQLMALRDDFHLRFD
jgi:transposase